MVFFIHMIFSLVLVVKQLPAAFALPMAKSFAMLPGGVVVDEVTLAGVAVKPVGHFWFRYSILWVTLCEDIPDQRSNDCTSSALTL
jgi:hypothetical protein